MGGPLLFAEGKVNCPLYSKGLRLSFMEMMLPPLLLPVPMPLQLVDLHLDL